VTNCVKLKEKRNKSNDQQTEEHSPRVMNKRRTIGEKKGLFGRGKILGVD